MEQHELLEKVRKIPDFPKPGILFYDITTLLQCPVTFGDVLETMARPFQRKKIDVICGIESRGFIFGSAMADTLGTGFVPVRKPGKLPWKTEKEEYHLEYGTDALEIHIDAIEKGQKVLIVDDLLATGGTAEATLKLVRRLGAEVAGMTFVMELNDLKGRDKLDNVEIFSLMRV